jgi:hypothetical protein
MHRQGLKAVQVELDRCVEVVLELNAMQQRPQPVHGEGGEPIVGPATVRAIASRSKLANHSFASCGGAPTSANRSAIGDMSDRVSLTSKTITRASMDQSLPPIRPGSRDGCLAARLD